MNTSPPIDEKCVAGVLENICELGCNHVDTVIAGLQNGSVPSVANDLNELELAKLLNELIAVMTPLKHP